MKGTVKIFIILIYSLLIILLYFPLDLLMIVRLISFRLFFPSRQDRDLDNRLASYFLLQSFFFFLKDSRNEVH